MYVCILVCFQVATALIPLSQALYANGDLGPARETCTRALKILQMAYGQSPTVEVSIGRAFVEMTNPLPSFHARHLRCCRTAGCRYVRGKSVSRPAEPTGFSWGAHGTQCYTSTCSLLTSLVRYDGSHVCRVKQRFPREEEHITVFNGQRTRESVQRLRDRLALLLISRPDGRGSPHIGDDSAGGESGDRRQGVGITEYGVRGEKMGGRR